MGIYPGNDSLSPAVKDRVRGTFQQAVALYKQGRVEDVVAGCNLLLQMDPMFDPAKKLLEKARNPASPIDVDSLLSGVAADDRLVQAKQALLSRDFQRAVQLSSDVLAASPSDVEARAIGGLAQEKLEAAPFVEQFVRKAEQLLASGNAAGARSEIQKARALDSDHPDLSPLERAIDAQASPAPQGFAFDAPSFGAPATEAPSFVVDTPAPASGRSTAQASDFGFTFEEEKAPEPSGAFASFSFDAPVEPAPAPKPAPAPPPPPADAGFGGFSFDTPSASSDSPFANAFGSGAPASTPAQAPPQASPAFASNEFDFSTASVETSPDDQAKISQYLGDGDRAFSAGEYQKAIDLWSRIFLIDVTNDVASERIERAKVKRREVEQKVESLMSSGVQAFDRRDMTTARAQFEEILRADPNHAGARDYLDRIESEGGSAAIPPSMPSGGIGMDLLDEEPMEGMYDAPMMPPDPDVFSKPAAPAPAAKKAATPKAAAAPATKRKLPLGLIGAVVAVVVLLGGGWFVWSRMGSTNQSDPAATQAVFKEASALASRGQYDRAILMLQDIKPDDPQHDRALGMIADLQQKKARSAEMIDGKPAAQFYQDSIAGAQTAFAAHDYVAAKNAFEQAMRVKPLTPDLKASYDAAAQQVSKLGSAKALFAERRYQEALTTLEGLQQADPENRNIERMLIDAHFNLGATALQQEKLPDAMKQFDEVLKRDPNDELAKRSRELAQRYEGEQKDLLFKIYVKYLPMRQAS